jgi:hypothetical protein
MKKAGIIICLLAAALCLAAADIVKDGKSNAVILIPKTSSRAVVFAAEELRKHLEAMTTAYIPVAWSDPDPRNEAFILAVARKKNGRAKSPRRRSPLRKQRNPLRRSESPATRGSPLSTESTAI